MKKMHARRLLKLADFLRNLPRKKFDIGTWKNETFDCGTVGCALGWACQIPSFQKAGLVLRRHLCIDQCEPEFMPTSEKEKSDCAHESCGISNGRGVHSYRAGQLFFGLADGEEYELFSPADYRHEDGTLFDPTPKQVAKRIVSVVKRHFPELVGKK